MNMKNKDKMKKKKRDKWHEKDYGIGYLFVGILIVTIIMGFYYLYPFEPQFTITKEVCEEEIQPDYMTIYGISSNETILVYDFGRVSSKTKKSLKESLEIADKEFDLICEKRQGKYFGSVGIPIKDVEHYSSILKSIELKNVYTCFEIQAICSQVEVNEIEILYNYDIGCFSGVNQKGKVYQYYDEEKMKNYCGIKKQNLTIEWLEGNCKCLEKKCTISYNKSQRLKITSENMEEFIGKTYDGPIEYTEENRAIFFEKGAKVIEECESCKNYKCWDYFVKVK